LPSKTPNILIANDDGIHAPGLRALTEALEGLGTLDVVAPHLERSGTAQSITLRQPIAVEQITEHRWAVEGTPTDCVILALNKLLAVKPDLVVSGINRGGNMGENVYYSGTLGAAMEGVINGIPGIAISLAHRGQEFDYADAARFARRLVELALREGLPAGVMLNVNVPNRWRGGVRLARQSKKITRTLLREGVDATGRPCFWLAEQPVGEPDAESDYAAVLAGDIAMTPLVLDRTDGACMRALAGWVGMLEEKK
jgi:5'-nucleotidase